MLTQPKEAAGRLRLYIRTRQMSHRMKLKTLFFVFAVVFAGSFALTGCLNDDNKIPPNCYDGVLNNGEEFIDCGGPNCNECNHCINGRWEPALGETWVDCGGECDACSQCGNGVRDADEVGIDCGGSNCGPCANLCGDGLLNGTEEEVDCGGAYCDACPTCTDLTMNGDEIGIDCGGSECSPCSTDGNCTNGLRDGNEFWTDCGGSTCPVCDSILNYSIVNPSQGESFPWETVTTNNGASLVVGGTSAVTGNSFGFSLTRPAGGWSTLGTALIPVTATNSGLYQVSFQDAASGLTYVSSEPTSNISFQVQRYVLLGAPSNIEFFRVYFTGTLSLVAPQVGTVEISGTFQYTY